MPAVGVPNNPSGANSWEGFGTEEPYGQATHDAQLAQASPMAGAALASGPIQSAKRAGRQAQRGAPAASQASPEPLPAPTPSPEAQLAQYWQAIAAIPGASPLVQQYAVLAAQKVANG